MSRVKLDIETIRVISLIQKITRCHVKDCLDYAGRLLIVVNALELSKAIGKAGANVKKLEQALAEAQKKRPEDPEVTRLKARLELVSKPLPMDPTLKELRRAKALSTEQIKEQRLTAAQDIAWALINNPSFLFNH